MFKLKQLVKAYYPKLNLSNFELESVRLVAKSRNGKGTAALSIGIRSSDAQQLAGTPSDFASEQARTYDRMTFVNPKNNSNGNWQIDLKGNIKVKKIVLNLERVGSTQPTPPTTPERASASCTAVLTTFWGQGLTSFTETAKARTVKLAKQKACDAALVKCNEARSSMNDLGNFLSCTI